MLVIKWLLMVYRLSHTGKDLCMIDEITTLCDNESGRFFRQLREKTGMSQSEVSRCCGVPQQTISWNEANGIQPRTNWNNLSRILKFYAQHGAPSLFSLVFKNGELIKTESLVEEHRARRVADQEKQVLRDRLIEALDYFESGAVTKTNNAAAMDVTP